nr:hypothetical protein [Kibdelosporangium sp. MJ126-NF4]CTQ98559.1 hypothetical protein [Kibdelosporangium sp. MJ126-NF4]
MSRHLRQLTKYPVFGQLVRSGEHLCQYRSPCNDFRPAQDPPPSAKRGTSTPR